MLTPLANFLIFIPEGTSASVVPCALRHTAGVGITSLKTTKVLKQLGLPFARACEVEKKVR